MTKKRPTTTVHVIKASEQSKKPKPMEAGKYLTQPFDGNTVATIYEQNPYHARCIAIKAGMSVGLGLNIVGTDGKAKKKQDDEYKRLQDFIDRHPDYAGQPFSETLLNFATDFEIYGHSYLEAVRNNKGDIAEIYHMPGGEMRIGLIKDPKTEEIKEQRAFQVIGLDVTEFIPWEGPQRTTSGKLSEYVQMKNYNPKDKYYGMPEWISVLAAIILDRKAQEFNIRKFDNFNIPDFIVSVTGGELDDTSVKAIGAFLRKNFGGVDNAGKALVVQSDGEKSAIKIDKLTEEVKEASYKLLREATRDEIVSAHGVPPRLVGIVSAGSLGQGTEAREQLRIFKDITMAPRYARIEFLLNNLIVKGLGIKGWRFQFNRYDGISGKDDAEFYGTMIDKGVLSPEKVREELGYLPEDGPKNPPADPNAQKSDTAADFIQRIIDLRKQLEAIQPIPAIKKLDHQHDA